MTDIINASVPGLRGPGLTAADTATLNEAKGQAAENAVSALGSANTSIAQADRAEGFAVIAETTTAGGWYDSLADGAAAVAEGEGFFVNDGNNFYTGQKVNSVGVKLASFTTRSSLKEYGINLWEEAAGDAETLDHAALADVLSTANSWKIGRVNCGGADKTYLIGGAPKQMTAGDGFNRHLIDVYSGISLHGASPASRATFLQAPGYTKPGGIFGNPWWSTTTPLEGFHVENLIFDGNSANQTVPVYAAGTTDGNVWQFQNLVEIHRGDRVSARDCLFRNAYGDGLGLTGADNDPYICKGMRTARNEFTNLMAIGISFTGNDFWSKDDYFHGDGFWVGGISIERLDLNGTMQDIWITGLRANWLDGLSPVEATVLSYASNTQQAQAARTHFRRTLSLSGDYYTGYPGDVFGGEFGRVSIIHPKITQGGILVGGFDRVFIDSPDIDCSLHEDVSLHWPPFNTPISIAPAFDGDAVTGLSEATVTNPRIRNDMSGPAIFLAAYERANVRGGSIVGSRSAGIRFEDCGGSVSDIDIWNVGMVNDRAYWQANNPGMSNADADNLIGAMSAGVTAVGNRGEITFKDIRAKETRTGAAALMTHAVYANVSTDTLNRLTDITGRNMTMGVIKDVNNSTLITGASDGTRTWSTNVPVTTGALTVNGGATIQSAAGDANLTLKSPAGANQIISFVTAAGIEAQLIQLDDGSFQINKFKDGVSEGTPIVFASDGHVIMDATWQEPLEMIPGTFLWVSATGVLRISTSRPTSDASGSSVGAQT